jgi:hypothetical protein
VHPLADLQPVPPGSRAPDDDPDVQHPSAPRAPPYTRAVIPWSAVGDRSEPAPSEQEKSAALDALGARRPLCPPGRRGSLR